MIQLSATLLGVIKLIQQLLHPVAVELRPPALLEYTPVVLFLRSSHLQKWLISPRVHETTSLALLGSFLYSVQSPSLSRLSTVFWVWAILQRSALSRTACFQSTAPVTEQQSPCFSVYSLCRCPSRVSFFIRHLQQSYPKNIDLSATQWTHP